MEFDPVYVGLKFQNSCFFMPKTSTYHKPLFITSFALLDITTGQMGNAIYLFFLHKIKRIPSLPLCPVVPPKNCKNPDIFQKIIYLHKNQAPRPIANERSLNSASDTLIKSSGNLHPTDLVTKER